MAENTLLEYYERIVKECLTECDGVCLLYNNGNCECVDGNVLDQLKELKAYRDAEEQGFVEIREKAIDEFAEKLCDELSEKTTDILVDGFKFDVLTLDGVVDIVWEIAERMKNGEINMESTRRNISN